MRTNLKETSHYIPFNSITSISTCNKKKIASEKLAALINPASGLHYRFQIGVHNYVIWQISTFRVTVSHNFDNGNYLVRSQSQQYSAKIAWTAFKVNTSTRSYITACQNIFFQIPPRASVLFSQTKLCHTKPKVIEKLKLFDPGNCKTEATILHLACPLLGRTVGLFHWSQIKTTHKARWVCFRQIEKLLCYRNFAQG